MKRKENGIFSIYIVTKSGSTTVQGKSESSQIVSEMQLKTQL